MTKAIKAQPAPREFKIQKASPLITLSAPPGSQNDISLYVDGVKYITMHHAPTINEPAHNYAFLEGMARGGMNECDTLEIDGVDRTKI